MASPGLSPVVRQQYVPFSTLRRLPARLSADARRVIVLPFVHGRKSDVEDIFRRVDGMAQREVESVLAQVMESFGGRHRNLEDIFEEHYRTARNIAGRTVEENRSRRLLLGGFFTMEYSIEAAGLFNPSVAPHPNQEGLEEGSLRFVMSLRATGEGHLSSVVFQTGVVDGNFAVEFDRPKPFSARTHLTPDQNYLKDLFRRTLGEMGVRMPTADRVLAGLGDRFTLAELEKRVAAVRGGGRSSQPRHVTLDSMLWLARSNYQLGLPDDADISELLIFPKSDNEARGIEDLRLVRFEDDDGTRTYCGTYTAFDGHRILPMLMETADFRRICIHTLNGACARNKGLALFPRRINGHFVMCSRIDGRNLYIMYSDYVHFWESAELLATPKYPWEWRLIGNCGSPIETAEGWLLLTHGVGPMRQYSIGAMLLDPDDPLRIRGRLRFPLICPTTEEREGYVPNVVYTCGGLIHRDRLFLPYAISDRFTSIVTVELDELLNRLLSDGP